MHFNDSIQEMKNNVNENIRTIITFFSFAWTLPLNFIETFWNFVSVSFLFLINVSVYFIRIIEMRLLELTLINVANERKTVHSVNWIVIHGNNFRFRYSRNKVDVFISKGAIHLKSSFTFLILHWFHSSVIIFEHIHANCYLFLSSFMAPILSQLVSLCTFFQFCQMKTS